MGELARDGRMWRIGTDAEVAWIANSTSIGRTITAAIPPVFEAYATVVLPERGERQDQHDRAVLGLLRGSRQASRGGSGISILAPMTSCSLMRRW
jgi:hypothetical protein